MRASACRKTHVALVDEKLLEVLLDSAAGMDGRRIYRTTRLRRKSITFQHSPVGFFANQHDVPCSVVHDPQTMHS
jgi:hypothetical protein